MTYLRRHCATQNISLLFFLPWAFFALWGCSTPAPVTYTPEERARVDNAIAVELSHQLEANLKFKQDPEVAIYLRALAQSLMNATPQLRSGAIGVLVVEDKPAASELTWRNFSIPGTRVYLSAGLLKNFEFENELAAAIAVEFGHILRRHVLERVQQNTEIFAGREPGVEAAAGGSVMEGLIAPTPAEIRSVPYFGARGIFSYSEQEQLAAAEEAVGVLYRAGFDPRGVVGLWEIFKKHPAHSPFDSKMLEKLLDTTRRAIAQNAPLRNPVVRSQAFIAVEKRIRKL